MAAQEIHNVLITAAGGNIGQPLVQRFVDEASRSSDKYKLVLPTRRLEHLKSVLPSSVPGVEIAIVQGDIGDPVWLESILREHGVETVMLNLTGVEELMLTLNCFDAMRRASVQHLVYISAAGDFSLKAVEQGLMKYIHAGHVAVKVTIEHKLVYGDLPFTWTILGPMLFFSNDLRSKGPMMAHGFFPEPLSRNGVGRVDPQDIGLGAYRAIEDRGRKWAKKKVTIGGRHLYTSDEITSLWGKALGKEISMAGTDQQSLDELARSFCQYIGGPPIWGRDFALMYVGFDQVPWYQQTDEEYKAQCALLGKEPNSYEEFVAKTGAQWLAEVKK
ncbi:NAD(P)-binding protein [Cryphonectria parasitica EP155]|uniref:NAD(P)-binding protein n=1 Tax=Cryphonectria parasitica (strain ATCC 38755 / EP155) TaxID=660469 RepID=A0A9P4YD05_CRYP1|nr:NAD(P)-binding protein [Cryphonectria parasitica EP155]KAF3770400.1 NAD(P)-binding protein [Cryphonectria parasitica EP155]